MKTFRIICLFACLIILGYHIYNLDYQDLGFKTNKGHYLGIFAMVFVGFNFLMGIIKEFKSKE